MERSIRYIFLLIWRAFYISSHLIIAWIYVSRAIFCILMVHHFLRTNGFHNVHFWKVGNVQFFLGIVLTYWLGLRGENLKKIFLVKIENKGTSFNVIRNNRQNRLTFVYTCYHPFQIMWLYTWEVTIMPFLHTAEWTRVFKNETNVSSQLNYHVIWNGWQQG